MSTDTLNKPLASYLIVQSALVLIVLAATQIVHPMVEQALGMQVPVLALSIFLVLLTQLPVAIMFAHFETRNLTKGEAWILGLTFVGFTVAAESGLQAVLGMWWPKVAARNGLESVAAQETLVFGVCLMLMLMMIMSFLVGALFQLAVRNNLQGGPRKTIYRPQAKQRARFLQRALCAGSAGLAGIGIAWATIAGWTLPQVFALVVLVLGALYAAVPRARNGEDVIWHKLWLETQPVVLTGLMTWAVTAFGMRYLIAAGSAAGMIAAFAPDLANVSQADLTAVTTQLSGIFLLLTCANVVVVWLFIAFLKPTLIKSRRPQKASAPTFERKPMAERLRPDLVPTDTGLPKHEAIAMVRTARELLAERDAMPRSTRPQAV